MLATKSKYRLLKSSLIIVYIELVFAEDIILLSALAGAAIADKTVINKPISNDLLSSTSDSLELLYILVEL